MCYGCQMQIIEMNGVVKNYGSFQALKGLDFKLSRAEKVCFLGPNGAGKTTAINIMLGLKKASSGSVRLFGEQPKQRKNRDRVGVMLQESGIPESLKVSEIINLIKATYSYSLPTSEIIEKADLSHKQSARVGSLSGGEKQRLFFALAIAGDPDLVFLDEPTVAMDVHSRKVFWEELDKFHKLGKSILFSTHYLEEADEFADRIVVINKGKKIAEGSPSEIKAVVASKTVEFKSTSDLTKYYSLGIKSLGNNSFHFYSNEPEPILKKLFADNVHLSDLSINSTDLEAAFVSLTEAES